MLLLGLTTSVALGPCAGSAVHPAITSADQKTAAEESAPIVLPLLDFSKAQFRTQLHLIVELIICCPGDVKLFHRSGLPAKVSKNI
jgi:hypothetical protein